MKLRRRFALTGASILAVGALVACGSSSDDVQDQPSQDDQLEPEDREDDGTGKADAWNAANNPAYVDANFAYFVDQLPVEGHGPIPIPGDYWAVAHDSLNVKWDGSNPSPAEKYATAFGKPDVPLKVSESNGVKSQSHRKACKQNSDCSDLKDGSICGKYQNEESGYCIPTWFGICHGWSPYALSERPARNPVTRKAADGTDVTFYPGDIEGLMSLMYTRVQTKFLSQRCNKDEPNITTDSHGRIVEGECRDMNPGSFFIVATNKMGLRHEGFVIDQTYDDEVWNQPAYGYKITNAVNGKIPEITKAEAAALLGLDMASTPLMPSATVKKDEQKTGEYEVTAAGKAQVQLSGTGDADLYVKVGSAPTTSSYDCRPYAGSSNETCDVDLQAGQKVYWMVVGYAAESTVQVNLLTPKPDPEYIYNTAAERFYHVEMDFSFVVEARPARTSHVDQYQSYLQTRHYSFVLEANKDGKVLGGEWLGESRTVHPDFAWWPVGKPTGAQAGGLITYEEVKSLNEESAGADEIADVESVLIDNYAFSTTGSWQSKYASIVTDPRHKKLVVTMTGTGDADLYVRANKNPTLSSYTCKSVTAGTSAETCTVDLTPDGKTYFVRARTRTPGTTVTVKANLTK